MNWRTMLGQSHVELATPADADRIAEIHGSSFPARWSADDFATLLNAQGVLCLVLREKGIFGTKRLSGFILTRTAADEAEILTLAVAPRARGKGYGRLLVEEAMRRLFRSRVLSLFLEVADNNQAALGLYRSLGFKEVGQRPHYYSERGGTSRTALVMRVQLR